MTKTPKYPRDANQLAKRIVDIATGDATKDCQEEESAQSKLGRSGGLKGERREQKLYPLRGVVKSPEKQRKSDGPQRLTRGNLDQ